MCGIAGASGRGAQAGAVRGMLRAIAHRGEARYACELRERAGTVLGAARLAIQDEPGGQQPFVARQGATALVLNGEIYNAAEIRERLGARAPFRTACDTEVALRAYLEWGEAFVDHLRGMFAIAVADGDSLVLARDPVGIKPLYFVSAADTTWFASELKAFADVAADERLCELEPGTVWRDGRSRRYWQMPPFDGSDDDPSSYIDALDGALRDAVSSHMPRSGTLACLLSGGIDSSTILLLADLLHAGEVEAWTLAAPDSPSDDLSAARAVCQRLGVTLHVVQPDVAELDEYYCARGVWMTETWEPALVRNAVSYHFLCRAVSGAGHKLCLSGEGADEVFGGYDYFRLLPEERRDTAVRDSLCEVYRTYLQMADRAAMATTLEVRVPYMDRRFVEAMAALPARTRLNGDVDKWALRHLYPAHLPARVRLRPKLGMNAGAGYGSNDPGASIYHAAVSARYAANERLRLADLELAREHGAPFGVDLDDAEEVHNFSRFLVLGYARLEPRQRPQLNVSRLAAEPVADPS